VLASGRKKISGRHCSCLSPICLGPLDYNIWEQDYSSGWKSCFWIELSCWWEVHLRLRVKNTKDSIVALRLRIHCTIFSADVFFHIDILHALSHTVQVTSEVGVHKLGVFKGGVLLFVKSHCTNSWDTPSGEISCWAYWWQTFWLPQMRTSSVTWCYWGIWMPWEFSCSRIAWLKRFGGISNSLILNFLVDFNVLLIGLNPIFIMTY